MGKQQPHRRQQILEAALRVFARDGFHKATIKQIASEAKLKSPALIYWYFKDKNELFQAVLIQLSPLINKTPSFEALMDHPPEEVLPLIARTFFSTFDNPDTVRLFRIFISEVARSPEVGNHFAQSGIMMALNFLIVYLQRQVDLGRLRPHDPQSSARSFMGTLVIYMMGREIFPPLRAGLPDPERYVQEVAAIFLDGLRS